VEHSAGINASLPSAAAGANLFAETARLLLRRITPDDLPFFAGLFADSEVMRFSMGLRTEAETQAWIDRCEVSYRNRGYGPWAIQRKSDGAMLGYCGLLDQEIDGRAEVEVGYRLIQPYWGQGYAPEAAGASCQIAFEQFRLVQVIALIDPLNTRSMRVAEKIGMAYTGDAVISDRRLRVYTIRDSAPRRGK
jgi:RimJ/RimL family protein N-acetyltransferase